MAQVLEQLTDWLYLTDDPTGRDDCGDDCLSDDSDRWYMIEFQLCTLGFIFAFSITLIGCSEMCVVNRNLRPSSPPRHPTTLHSDLSRPRNYKTKSQSCNFFFLGILDVVARAWMPASVAQCVLYLKHIRDTFCRRSATNYSQSIGMRYVRLTTNIKRQESAIPKLRRVPTPTARLRSKPLSQPSKLNQAKASKICFSETTFECRGVWDPAREALHTQDWQKVHRCTSAYIYGSVKPTKAILPNNIAARMKTGCGDCLWSNGTGYLKNKNYTENEEGRELQCSTNERGVVMEKVSKRNAQKFQKGAVTNSPYTPPVRFIKFGKTQDIVLTTHSLATEKVSCCSNQCAASSQHGPLPGRRKIDGANVCSGRISPNVEDAMSDLLCGDVSVIVNKYSFTKDPTGSMQTISLTSDLQNNQVISNKLCPVKCQKEAERRYNRPLKNSVFKKAVNATGENYDRKEANIKPSDRFKKTAKHSNGESTHARRILGQPSEKINTKVTTSSSVVDSKLSEKDTDEHSNRNHSKETETLASFFAGPNSRSDTLSRTVDHPEKNKKIPTETIKQQQQQQQQQHRQQVRKKYWRNVICKKEKTLQNEIDTNDASEKTKPEDAHKPEPADHDLNLKVAKGKQRCRFQLNTVKNSRTQGLHEAPQRLSTITENELRSPETAAENEKCKYRAFWHSKPRCRKVKCKREKLKETVDDALDLISDNKQRELRNLSTDCSTYLQATLEMIKFFYERDEQKRISEWKGPFPRKSFSEKFRPYNVERRTHSHVSRCHEQQCCMKTIISLEPNVEGDDVEQLACVATDKSSNEESQTQVTSTRDIHRLFEQGTSCTTCDTVAFLDFFLHLPAFLQLQQQRPQVKKMKKPAIDLGSSSEEITRIGLNKIQPAKRIQNLEVDKTKKLRASSEAMDRSSGMSDTSSKFNAETSVPESVGFADISKAEEHSSKESGMAKYLNNCLQEQMNKNSDLCKVSAEENQNSTFYLCSQQNLELDPTYVKVKGQGKAENSRSSGDSSTISTLHQVTSFTEQIHSNKWNKPEAETPDVNMSIHNLREMVVSKVSRAQLKPVCPVGRVTAAGPQRSKIPIPVNCRRCLENQENEEERRSGNQIDYMSPNNNVHINLGRDGDDEEFSRKSPHIESPHQKITSTEETCTSKIKKKAKYQVVIASLSKEEQQKVQQKKAKFKISRRKFERLRAMTDSHLKKNNGQTKKHGHSYRSNGRPSRDSAIENTRCEMDTSLFKSRTSAPKLPGKPTQRNIDFAKTEQGLDRSNCRRRRREKDHHGRFLGDSLLLTQRSAWSPNSQPSELFPVRIPLMPKSLLSRGQDQLGCGEQTENTSQVLGKIQDRTETHPTSKMAKYVEAQWLHSASEEALLVSLDELDRKLEDIHTQMTDITSRTFVKELGQVEEMPQEQSSKDKRGVFLGMKTGLQSTQFKSRSSTEPVSAGKPREGSRMGKLKDSNNRGHYDGACVLEAHQRQFVSDKQKITGISQKQVAKSFTKRSMTDHRPKLCRPGVRTFYQMCDPVTQSGRQHARSRSSGVRAKEESSPQIKDPTLATSMAKVVIAAIDRHSKGLSPDRWRHTTELHQSMKHSHSLRRPTRYHDDHTPLSNPSRAHYPHTSAKTHSQSRQLDKGETAHGTQHHPEGRLTRDTREARNVQEREAGGKAETCGGKIRTNAEIDGGKIRKNIERTNSEEGMPVKKSSSTLKKDAASKLPQIPVQSEIRIFRQSSEDDKLIIAKAHDADKELHKESSRIEAKNRSDVYISKSHRKTSREMMVSLKKAELIEPGPCVGQCRSREKAPEKHATPQKSPSFLRIKDDESEPFSKISVVAGSPGEACSSRTRQNRKCPNNQQRDAMPSFSSPENGSCKIQRSVCSNSTVNVARSSSRIEIKSPTDQFTEVECPDETQCRRTKLVRNVPEDLLISIWGRKPHAVATEKPKKITTQVSKISTKGNAAKEKRYEVQPVSLSSNSSRGMGQFVVPGNLSAIKSGLHEVRKLPERAKGLYKEHQDSERRPESKNNVPFHQEGRLCSKTDSNKRRLHTIDNTDRVHNGVLVSRADIRKCVPCTDDSVSTTSKVKVKRKWLKPGSKSDHCWKKQSCEQNFSQSENLTRKRSPGVMTTISVPLLAGKGDKTRSSWILLNQLPVLSPGCTGQYSSHEQGGTELWRFEPGRRQQTSTEMLGEVSPLGPDVNLPVSSRYLRSKGKSSAAKDTTKMVIPERLSGNPHICNKIGQEYPSRERNHDNKEQHEGTDNLSQFYPEGDVRSEKPARQIPPDNQTNRKNNKSMILEDPARVSCAECRENNTRNQVTSTRQADGSHLVKQDPRPENNSLMPDHNVSIRNPECSSNDPVVAKQIQRRDETNELGKQRTSSRVNGACLRRKSRRISSRSDEQNHSKNIQSVNVNPEGLMASGVRSAAAEITDKKRLAQSCRRPQSTAKVNHEEPHPQHLAGNIAEIQSASTKKESEIPDGNSCRSRAGDFNKHDNTEMIRAKGDLDEMRKLQENDELQSSGFVWERDNSGVFLGRERKDKRDHIGDGEVPYQHGHLTGKYPVASKEDLQEQPRNSRQRLRRNLQDMGSRTQPSSNGNYRVPCGDSARMKTLKPWQGHQGVCSEHETHAHQLGENPDLGSVGAQCSRDSTDTPCSTGDLVGNRKQKSDMKDVDHTKFVVKSNINHCWREECRHQGSEFKAAGMQSDRRRTHSQVPSEKEALKCQEFTESEQKAVSRTCVLRNKRFSCVEQEQITVLKPLPRDSRARRDFNNQKGNHRNQSPRLHSVNSCQSKGFLLTTATGATSASPSVSNSSPIAKGRSRYSVKHRLSGNLDKKVHRMPDQNSPVRTRRWQSSEAKTGPDPETFRDRKNLQSHELGRQKQRDMLKRPCTLNSSPARRSQESVMQHNSDGIVSSCDLASPDLKLTHSQTGRRSTKSFSHHTQDDTDVTPESPVGFSYLNHQQPDTSTRHTVTPPPTEHASRQCPSRRIKQPKEDSFVGKIVKMFEKRLQSLPSDESHKDTEEEQSG